MDTTNTDTITTGNAGAAVYLLLAGYTILGMQQMPERPQHVSFTFPADAARQLAAYLEASKALHHRIGRDRRARVERPRCPATQSPSRTSPIASSSTAPRASCARQSRRSAS